MKNKISDLLVKWPFKFVVGIFIIVITMNSAIADSEKHFSSLVNNDRCIFSGQFVQLISDNKGSESIKSKGLIFSDCSHGVIIKTESPERKAKILTSINENYKVDFQNEIKPLKGIAESLRSKLMVSILRADETYIKKHFEIDQQNNHSALLIPKTKSYKRGLQNLGISNSENQIVIDLLDKRGQSLNMVISDISVYDNQNTNVDYCNQLFTETEYCNILKQPRKYKVR